jgi:hypothetical protein
LLLQRTNLSRSQAGRQQGCLSDVQPSDQLDVDAESQLSLGTLIVSGQSWACKLQGEGLIHYCYRPLPMPVALAIP